MKVEQIIRFSISTFAIGIVLLSAFALPQAVHKQYTSSKACHQWLLNWLDETIALLELFEVQEASLGDDLVNIKRGIGYQVVLRFAEVAVTRGFRPPRLKVYCANNSSRKKVELGIDNIVCLVSEYK